MIHFAQRVIDVLSNRTVGVAMGTSLLENLSELLSMIKPKIGVVYVVSSPTGQLVSSSDLDPLWATSPSGTKPS